MKTTITLCWLILLLTGCQDNDSNKARRPISQNVKKEDTIVAQKDVLNKVAGSAYLKRAKQYFLIINGDTSEYSCIFSETKEGGRTSLDLNLPYQKTGMTYRQRIKQLSNILPQAAKDFSFDSVEISFGRLILSGDLVVTVTREYANRFGASNRIQLSDYKEVEKFLASSQLAKDMDSVFRPYSLSVANVSIEKCFFTDKKEVFQYNRLETDSANVPDRILDCMTWASLRKEQ